MHKKNKIYLAGKITGEEPEQYHEKFNKYREKLISEALRKEIIYLTTLK